MFEGIGHYKVLDRIGAGGLGEVYRARDLRFGRTVAVRILPPTITEDPVLRQTFLQDARVATALSHPGIAAVYDVGEEAGWVYVVTEYVAGETLRSVMGDRALNPRRAVDLAFQLAEALAEAHAAAIIHGDLKPGNIIVTQTGRAKMLDLGLSRWTEGGAMREAAATLAECSTADVLNTLSYMSPEQALAERTDHRTDIFSLGVILYEMLTGQSPFARQTASATLMQILGATPPVPSSFNSRLGPELDRIAGRALAKSLETRYQDAREMAAELREAQSALEALKRLARKEPSRKEPARPPAASVRSQRAVWILVTVIVLLLAGLASFFFREDILDLWQRWSHTRGD
ncbi:MAG: serine/threonine protein kinase [Acidobacteria bacterium]|nr:serine/threonine protein kinase [Acidobacteriota bacterium]